jgi:hypothetical protein
MKKRKIPNMQKDLLLLSQTITQYLPPAKSTWFFLLVAYAFVSLLSLVVPAYFFDPTQGLILPLLTYPFKLHPVGPFSLVLFLGVILFMADRRRFQGDITSILIALSPLFILWLILNLLESILPISTLTAILMEILILSFFHQELKHKFNDAILFKVVCYLIFVPNIITVLWLHFGFQSGNAHSKAKLLFAYWPGLVALHKGLLLLVVLKYKNSILPILNTPGKHLSSFLLAFCLFELLFEPFPTGVLSLLGFSIAAILESNRYQLLPINPKAVIARVF